MFGWSFSCGGNDKTVHIYPGSDKYENDALQVINERETSLPYLILGCTNMRLFFSVTLSQLPKSYFFHKNQNTYLRFTLHGRHAANLFSCVE